MNASTNEKYLFAGGGTGGHLYPALAIAERILAERPNSSVCFVGTKQGLENRVIPEKGFVLYYLAVRGVKRKLTLANLLVPFRIIWSLFQCVQILQKEKPRAVIGTGGYVSGPVLFVASLLKYPTLIQEQNSYPGVTTRILAKRVNKVHLSFKDSLKYFQKQENITISGNPVRNFDTTLGKSNAKESFGLNAKKSTLFIFGGSQGAMAINTAILAILDKLMLETEIQLLWSTGRFGFGKVKMDTEKYSNRIKVKEFIGDMEKAYAASDFCVCRAGAMTLAEITLCGIPSILVPYPYAAANHQEANARSLEKDGAAKVILESEMTDKLLFNQIKHFSYDEQNREQMSKAANSSSFQMQQQKL
jgi:UDP-N-acetylglucosamine--N-acetylmuramyl-(pentapeptide) pyrophosphoryl-undecaprenol N-acetylglucosamine transferase